MNAPPTPDETIDRDLACSGCGYNLRGLGVAARCPECGHGVVRTLLNAPLESRAAWLRALSRGSLLIGAGVLLGGVSATAVLFMSRGPWLLAAFAAACALGAIGTWQFAAPAPDSPSRRSSIALRVAGVATCTLQFQLAFAAALALRFNVAVTLPVMAQCTVVVWLIASTLTCARAAGLARRLGDISGFVQAWIVAALSAAAMLMFARGDWMTATSRQATTIASVAACVWSAVFFLGFALVLRRGACSAAAAADACSFEFTKESPCPTM